MGWYDRYASFSALKGLTLTDVRRTERWGDDMLVFETAEGRTFEMYHESDCCESVYIEDVVGDLSKLRGLVLDAEECESDPLGRAEPDNGGESETWTYYRIATMDERVSIRWYGTSNGYYSESVSFYEVTKEDLN